MHLRTSLDCRHFAALALLVAQANLTLAAEPRLWTSANGKFTTEAELINYTSDSVRLENASGKTIDVPLSKLSQADLKHLGTETSYRYRVPDKLTLQSPGYGAMWKVTKDVQADHGWSVVLKAEGGSPNSAFRLVFVSDALAVEPTDEQEKSLAAELALPTIKGLQGTHDYQGLEFDKVLIDGESVWSYATLLIERESSAELFLTVTSVVRDRRVYQMLMLANKSFFDDLEGDEQRRLIQLPLTSKQPSNDP